MTTTHPTQPNNLSDLNIELERDVFLRTLIRELSGTLQDVVGLNEAAGFVSVVGQRSRRNHRWKIPCRPRRFAFNPSAGVGGPGRFEAADSGGFLHHRGDRRKNRAGQPAVPFAEKVLDRPALCMMTSNVFGSIAAQNLGYAKVQLQQTIASGAGECRVVVYLKPSPACDAAEGREYVRG